MISTPLSRGLLLLATALLAAGTLSARQGPPPPPPPPPMIPGSQSDTAMEGTGAISGVVIDGTTGNPVSGALVSLVRGGPALLAVRQITDGTLQTAAGQPASEYFVVVFSADRAPGFPTKNTKRTKATKTSWVALKMGFPKNRSS